MQIKTHIRNIGLTSILFIINLAPFSAQALTGNYRGTVTITSPTTIGELDLAIDLKDEDGKLSGFINTDQTIIFPKINSKGPAVTGNVDKASKTFTITSNAFTQEVSGRTVTRQITLTNGQISEAGDKINGHYQEVIKGFIPQDITVEGNYELLRPTSSQNCSDRDGDKIISLYEIADGGGKDIYKIELGEFLAAMKLFLMDAGKKNASIKLDTILKTIKGFMGQLKPVR